MVFGLGPTRSVIPIRFAGGDDDGGAWWCAEPGLEHDAEPVLTFVLVELGQFARRLQFGDGAPRQRDRFGVGRRRRRRAVRAFKTLAARSWHSRVW